MKLLTLNAHSLQVEDYPRKVEEFVAAVRRLRPDIIALQEVSQTALAPLLPEQYRFRQFPIPGTRPLHADNHAARVAWLLNQAGVECYWAWLPIKVAYEHNEEGVAFLSLGRPIAEADWFFLSNDTRFSNWAARAALGIRVEGMADWFYTLHTGWWDAVPEPFQDHFARLRDAVAHKRGSGPVWLMGDFNCPDHLRGQGYDAILADGWKDTHLLAGDKDRGITVPRVIDGWHERREAVAEGGMRLDYIFCSYDAKIQSSRAVFSGVQEAIVSDHFGMLVETAPYVPAPMDTSDVVLPPELQELAELLSKNTHAQWARQRLAQGWTWGPLRDDGAKTTPCLIPYESLPEVEKAYDRNTALETVKVLLKLGYRITKA